MLFGFVVLEINFQGELPLPRRSGSDLAAVCVSDRLSNAPEIWVRHARSRIAASHWIHGGADPAVGLSKIWMIEDIEKIHAELHLHAFSNGKILHQRKIP